MELIYKLKKIFGYLYLIYLLSAQLILEQNKMFGLSITVLLVKTLPVVFEYICISTSSLVVV